MAPVAGSGACPAWIARVSNSIGLILVSTLDLPGTQERGQRFERLVQPRGITPRTEQLERSRLAVEARFGTPNEAVADEQRQDVVAVLALGLRHVHLEPEAEVEERLGPIPVVDEAIERRKQRRAVRDVSVRDVRMRFPALLRVADAERAE